MDSDAAKVLEGAPRRQEKLFLKAIGNSPQIGQRAWLKIVSLKHDGQT